MRSATAESGHLYGVGVGPGDPGLITRRAAELIASAEVVVYHAGTGRTSNARAIAAALLAHVKDDDSGASLPVLMSKREQEGDRPPVSPLRFRRLLETTDVEDLFVGLRRVLPLLSHRANVVALANDVVNWGDLTRKRWAYAYNWPQTS